MYNMASKLETLLTHSAEDLKLRGVLNEHESFIHGLYYFEETELTSKLREEPTLYFHINQPTEEMTNIVLEVAPEMYHQTIALLNPFDNLSKFCFIYTEELPF